MRVGALRPPGRDAVQRLRILREEGDEVVSLEVCDEEVLDGRARASGSGAPRGGVRDGGAVEMNRHCTSLRGRAGGAALRHGGEEAIRPVAERAVIPVSGEAHGGLLRLLVLIEEDDLHVVCLEGRHVVDELAEAVDERLAVGLDEESDALILSHGLREHPRELGLVGGVEVELRLLDSY